MTSRFVAGVVAIALLFVPVVQTQVAQAAGLPPSQTGGVPLVQAATVGNSQSHTDASGGVLDAITGTKVTNQPAANVKTVTAKDVNGIVTLSLGIYGVSPDPLTDPGWTTNTPANTVTYVGWELAASSGRTYVAFFTSNVTSAQSGIAGELTFDDNGTPITVSCQVRASYSPSTGYAVSFAASCIGNPTAFAWNSFISYHPVGYPADDSVGKVAPEQGAFPHKLQYGPSVNSGPPVSTTQGRSPASGYWLFASDGGVFTHGSAGFRGSAGGHHLNAPVVGSAGTSDSGGYWLVASDGGIFTYGDALFYGSAGGHHLNKPIVGMAPTPDGGGYWLVASDGGIFTYGDALFYGSAGGHHLNKPIVGMAPTPDGKGYWLVASDGGIFSFGDAKFHGSAGSYHLNKPIVGMAATPDGKGYWLVASDGGIFSFGDAKFHGSAGSYHLNKPIVGMASTGVSGYWLVASDGGIFTFGDAKFYGSQGFEPLNEPVVVMSAAGS